MIGVLRNSQSESDMFHELETSELTRAGGRLSNNFVKKKKKYDC
jgi:hypothetical protein